MGMRPFPESLRAQYPILPAPPPGAERLTAFCAARGLRFSTIVKALRAGRAPVRAFRVVLPRARKSAAVPQWSWWVDPSRGVKKPPPPQSEKIRAAELWRRVESDKVLPRGVFADAVLAEIADYFSTFRAILPPAPSVEDLRRGEALPFERLAVFVRAAALFRIYPARASGARLSLHAGQTRLDAANVLLASAGIPWRDSLRRWHT